MNYYVFICLDGVPILDTILDENFIAVEEIKELDWVQTKYIILDFKSNNSKKFKPVEKGKITYNEKVLTNQIIYFRINIFATQKISTKAKNIAFSEEEQLIELAKILFVKKPKDFIKYIKKKKILRKKDIKSLEKAFLNQMREQEILDSWKNIKTS